MSTLYLNLPLRHLSSSISKVIKPTYSLTTGLLLVCIGTSLTAQAETSSNKNVIIEHRPSLETLVISQRIERPIQQVPVNITVVSPQSIQDLQAQNLTEIATSIANTYLLEMPGDYTFQVRGLPRNLQQTNVPIYIDGVPQTGVNRIDFSLLDIEQIEFLRGPQGNLYGSNARDGLISIQTQRLQKKPQGSISLSKSTHTKSLAVQGSTALIENVLQFKGATKILKSDGYVKNILLNNNTNERDEIAYSAALYWQPSEQFNAKLSLDYSDLDNGPYNYVDGAQHLSAGDDLQTAMDEPNEYRQKNKGSSLSLDWQLSPSLKLSSVTGWRTNNIDAHIDTDATALLYGYIETQLNEKELFQELRLASTPQEGPIDWLLGFSYFNNQEDNKNMYSSYTNDAKAQLKRRAANLYTDMTWRFADQWRMQAGVRYSTETVSAQSYYRSGPTETSGYQQESYAHILPKLAFNYDFTPHSSLYISYGEGMLSGGAGWLQEDTESNGTRKGTAMFFDEELSSNLEVGYKAYLPASDIEFDIALFYSKIKDYQHFYADHLGLTRVISVDEVSSKGIEASISAPINDQLSVKFNAGYNHATVAKADEAATSLTPGSRIPGAPKYNASLLFSYDTPINHNWHSRTNLQITHHGSSVFDRHAKLKQGSYTVLNLNSTFEYKNDWSIKLWGKNLTDQRYQTDHIQFAPIDVASYGAPRTFGIDLTKKF